MSALITISAGDRVVASHDKDTHETKISDDVTVDELELVIHHLFVFGLEDKRDGAKTISSRFGVFKIHNN